MSATSMCGGVRRFDKRRTARCAVSHIRGGSELKDLKRYIQMVILEIFNFLIDFRVIRKCDFLKFDFLIDSNLYAQHLPLHIPLRCNP